MNDRPCFGWVFLFPASFQTIQMAGVPTAWNGSYNQEGYYLTGTKDAL
jgi:hypothetical protein